MKCDICYKEIERSSNPTKKVNQCYYCYMGIAYHNGKILGEQYAKKDN